MQPTDLDIELVKAVFQQQSVAFATRMTALAAALALFVAVLEAVRRRKLLEEFTPIWLTCALGILALAISFDAVIWLADLIGAWTPSSAVFFFGLAFLMAISLGYAMRLSSLSAQVKILAQEIALMKAEQPAAERE